MKKLNHTLGFYTPAFFKIYIETVQPITPSTLYGQELSTFVHEYTHFIQDFTTLYGLNNIYNLLDWLRLYVNKIYKTHKIQLPLNYSHPILSLNDEIRRHSWGYQQIYIPTSTIKKVQIIPHHFPENVIKEHLELSNFRKVLVSIETQGRDLDIEFGSLAIMESMAHMMESFLNPAYVTNSPYYPYNIAQSLARYVYPRIGNNDEMVFALCDIALQTSIPGATFLEMIKLIHDGKTSITINSADDIYTCFNKQFTIWHDCSNPQNLVCQAIEHLYTIIQGPMGEQYQAWVNNLMTQAVQLRSNHPSFLLDIIRGGNVHQNKPFTNFLNKIGTPLLTNSVGFITKIPASITGTFPVNMDVEYFQSINYIYSLLTEGRTECPLQEWCKTSGTQIDQNCITNPPAHSDIQKYSQFCPVGALWHHWKLKKYGIRSPFLFRRICS